MGGADRPTGGGFGMGEHVPVEVRRSARRTRSVSAHRQGDHYVVSIPARFSAAQEAEWVARMTARLQAREQTAVADDASLARRAQELSIQYFNGKARPRSVRWVANQATRWGSCTPARGTIRISHRLRNAPDWVVDYVLVHELAHLFVAKHDEKFWGMVAAYPLAERARGFLEGLAAAPGMDLERLPTGEDNDVIG